MTIALKKENFAKSTLEGGVLVGGAALDVKPGDGAKFPSSGPFRAVIWGASHADPADDPNREVVEASLSSGDTFDITRAKEGTTARAWSSGDNFALTITKGVLDEMESEIASHTHDGRYYTEAEIDAGQMDSRYYTEAELDSGQMDGRYYTEAEIDMRLAPRGALVTRTTAQSIPNGATTSISFDSEDHDTDGIHEGATNPERLTVPSGVSRVRLGATVVWDTNSTGYRLARMYKNGSIFTGSPYVGVNAGVSTTAHNLRSALVSVSPGDYFTVEVYQNSGASLNTIANLCWFSMEIVQ